MKYLPINCIKKLFSIEERGAMGSTVLIKKKTKEERSFSNYLVPVVALFTSSLFFLSGYYGWWRL